MQKEYDLEILDFVLQHPNSSSSEIHSHIGFNTSLLTTKRRLSNLVAKDFLFKTGKGRATKYKLNEAYKLNLPIDVELYFKNDINERHCTEHFNFELLNELLPGTRLFTNSETDYLKQLQKKYIKNISTLSNTLYKKDLERLGIDLSWKSSQIEGNTYTLLETEQLLKEQKEAKGRQKEEAQMLLNHKTALDYIIDSPNYYLHIDLTKIIEVHSLLVDGLGVEKKIRSRLIGITGTNYKPLENEHQIKEALIQTCNLVNTAEETFEKALLILLLLSYIQAFEDGNKRTARLMSNAVLISNNYCPISFRTVDSINYKKAMLIFYEQNNISAFKKIFIEQYEFAVNNYFQ